MVAYTYYERDPRVRREAEALVDAGNSVSIISLRENSEPANDIYNGVRVYRLPLKRQRGGALEYIVNYIAFFILSFFYASALYFRNMYNIFYVHNMPDFLVFTGIVPKMMGKPVILDVHDPMPELFSTIFAGRLNSLIFRILLFQEKLSHNFASHLITVSEGMRLLLLSRGVSGDKLEVIHNFPDPSIFHKIQARHSTDFTIAYVGTISPRHRLDLLIQAVALLSDVFPKIQIRIVGDGPAVNGLVNLVKKYRISERVIFEGVVPIEEVPQILGESTAAIASYADDAFGNLVFPTKVFEALMVGTPVICARVPAIQRYFDESTLYYFEPGNITSLTDQIRSIYLYPTQVQERLARCSKIVQNLSWEIEKKRYVELINQTISI